MNSYGYVCSTDAAHFAHYLCSHIHNIVCILKTGTPIIYITCSVPSSRLHRQALSEWVGVTPDVAFMVQPKIGNAVVSRGGMTTSSWEKYKNLHYSLYFDNKGPSVDTDDATIC